MKFDELDSQMRAFESARDPAAIPDTYLVARLDGRGFTRLTKELLDYQRPFDDRFRDAMLATVEHLMTCGFTFLLGYTQSDEISLLAGPRENAFARNIRKWTSVLAGEASAAFSIQINRPAAFDCRIIELPTQRLAIDYFRWRQEDAHRNALNAWCYWTLRAEGESIKSATSILEGMSVAAKNELLFQRGINFNNLPVWQRRGATITWETFDKPATNPVTGEQVSASRRRLAKSLELPMRDEYGAMVEQLLLESPSQ